MKKRTPEDRSLIASLTTDMSIYPNFNEPGPHVIYDMTRTAEGWEVKARVVLPCKKQKP